MSTWNALFDAAMQEIGYVAPGDTGPTADRTYCLGVTNRMLSGWSAEIGPLHFETVDSLSWASGNASRTIGSGGDFSVARPERLIKAAYRDSGSVDNPITLITHQQYQEIEQKTLTSDMPLALAYNPTIASGLGTLFIWPIPSSTVTIRLTSYKPFSTITDQTAESGLPSGYEAAIVPNLAILIASAYGRDPSQMTYREAERTKSAILRANVIPQPMKPDYGGGTVDSINLWTIG